MENAIVHLRPGATLQLQVVREVNFPEPGMRFNDGRCDRAGRFWVSSMLNDMSRDAAQDGALFVTQPGATGLPEAPYTPTPGDTR